MEEEGMDEAPPEAHNGLLLYVAAAVLMEILFLVLVLDRSIIHAIGLRQMGPLRTMSDANGTLVSGVILGAGFVAGFFLYSRMGSRVGGVIAIPLAAVEALFSPAIVPFLLLGIGIAYSIGEPFFQKLLIYGRRLFYVYLTVSVLVMVQLMIGFSLEPLSFSFIIPGIIAYNLHVDRDKTKSVIIADLYFAGLALLGIAVVALGRF